MDRKSSFKECPKCGLRNKPSSIQCDFCGQALGDSDDWQQHIKDLESLNKVELRKPLDDRTSKRIESTIIRKEVPSNRNMEIREAGNIGKAFKYLDEPPAKENGGDIKVERPRHAPGQDKLRIKETYFGPLVERDAVVTSQPKEGSTIADLMNEPPKDVESSAPPAETRPLEDMLRSAAASKEPVDESVTEPADQEPELVQQPDEPEGSEPEAAEEPLPEEPIPTADPAGPSDEVVLANEVTIETVQPLHEPVPSTEGPSGEDQQITVSSNGSHETIKLKLVEVERPREKLAPVAVERRTPRSTLAAIAVLAIGTVAYLVVLALIAVGLLGTAEGLGGGAVSSIMMIYGTVLVYPSLRKKDEAEVYICPKCHEKVGKSSDGCPACGIEFEFED